MLPPIRSSLLAGFFVGLTIHLALIAPARASSAGVVGADPKPAWSHPAETAFVGRVVGANGAPEADAVVVSSAGGQAVTASDGSFRLIVPLPPGSTSVQVTAVAASGSASRTASTRIPTPFTVGSVAAGTLTLQATAGCQATWLPTFGQRPGTNQFVYALEVFDDGSGPALYAGGVFSAAGGLDVNYIAKWDGTRWSALGSGLNNYVHSLAVFDDGSGPALYVGGEFTFAGGVTAERLAKWDGTSWSAVGSGMNSDVDALAVFDDGSGPALYAGGWFSIAGGVPAPRIAKWNGSSWAQLGSGMSFGAVYALSVFDDGTGPALYAGGGFVVAGGVAANGIAKWNGTTWTALGSGVDFDGTNSGVRALEVFDDGTGPALFACGPFNTAGGVPANRIAKWDGSTWSALGSGVSEFATSLAVFDDGSGPALYVAGFFTQAGGVVVDCVARWNGTSWSALGSGTSGAYVSVYALQVFDDGSGPALFAGNRKWGGSSWAVLGNGLNWAVRALAVFDDGGGPALYAGGDFTIAGGVTVNHIAKWNGSSWSAVGRGISGYYVSSLAVFDDGSGPALYAGGWFTTAGSVQANYIAKWDGSNWSAVGLGTNHTVDSLAVFDDGNGPALYAGGTFTSPASHIARWNGTSWSSAGAGVDNNVYALTVFDDGSGPALFASGHFLNAGGVAANRIAKWNGSSWSALGSGMDSYVIALTVFDDGSGRALYAGGSFTTAGGAAAVRIAKWNGANWSPLGSGLDWHVYALTVFDDGSGPVLCAGGEFTTAGGFPASCIAQWDGSTWFALGSGMSTAVFDLAVFDDGAGPALYAAGAFATHPDTGDSFLAKWGNCPCMVGTAYCFGDAGCPCGNNGPTGGGCLNSLGTSGRLTAAGCASLSSDTVVLTGTGMPDSFTLYYQALSQAAGPTFGDGLRCAFGSVIRLGTQLNVSGTSQYPEATDPPISVRGAIATPGTRDYQVWYRNAASFCTTSTFNLTNGLEIAWNP